MRGILGSITINQHGSTFLQPQRLVRGRKIRIGRPPTLHCSQFEASLPYLSHGLKKTNKQKHKTREGVELELAHLVKVLAVCEGLSLISNIHIEDKCGGTWLIILFLYKPWSGENRQILRPCIWDLVRFCPYKTKYLTPENTLWLTSAHTTYLEEA